MQDGHIDAMAQQRIAALEEEVARLRTEAAAHSEKIAHAETEVAEQREDIAEQACDQAEMESEIERLQYEREQMRGNLVRAKADLAFVERKFADAERQIHDKDQLLKRPAATIAQKDRKNKQLETQLAEKDAVVKTLRDQLSEARAALSKGTAGMHSEESRAQLLRHLASAQKGQTMAEEELRSLKQRLEERSRCLEEAQTETERLVQELKDAEKRNLQLTERLSEAQEQPAPEPENPAGADEEQAAVLQVALASQAERHQAEVKRLEGQLRAATQVLAEYEDTATQLRARLTDCEASPSQNHQTKERLQALARRCRELEAAGRKLLTELDEKEELLAEREMELEFLRCASGSPGPHRQGPISDSDGFARCRSGDVGVSNSMEERSSSSVPHERSRSGSRSRELPREDQSQLRCQRQERSVGKATPLSGRCWGPRQPDVSSAAHVAGRAGWQTVRTWQNGAQWLHGGSSWHGGSYAGSWASCSDRD